MATVLEQALSVGIETSWGQAVRPTRSYEVLDDQWRPIVNRVKAPLYVQGQSDSRTRLTDTPDTDRVVVVGAEGSLGLPVRANGLPMLLRHSFGGYVFSSGLRRHRFFPIVQGPSGSYTITMYRVLADGSGSRYYYAGCVPTDMSVSCAVGGFVRLGLTFDAAQEYIGSGSVAPAYQADGPMLTWETAAVSWSPVGNLEGVESFTFQGRTGLRRSPKPTLRRVKTRPRPIELAQYRATVVVVAYDVDAYIRLFRGTIGRLQFAVRDPLTGRTAFRVVMPDAKLDSSRVRAHRGRLTTLELDFKIYESRSAPTVFIDVWADDPAVG